MHLKLKDQQVKTVLFIYRPLYQNFMEITNQKSTIDEKKKNTTHKEKQSKTTLKLVIKSQETRTKEEKRLTNSKQLTKWQ